MNDIPTAIWEGEFTIFGVMLRCYVLDNPERTRVIQAEDMERLFEVMGQGDCPPLDALAMEKFMKWQKGLA